jgi:hypothetical protein
LPCFYKDKIQFDEPKILVETIRNPSTNMIKEKEERLFRSIVIHVDIGGHPPIPQARKTVFHHGGFFDSFSGSKLSRPF